MSVTLCSSSAASYSRGCRCDGCRAAHAERLRAYYRGVGGNKNRKPHHKQSANPWTEARRERAQLRRAQKAGTQTEQIVNPQVFERDGWLCGICGESVDCGLLYPDRRSASLDHIVPLSVGGTHTYDNVRLAHLCCNVARGNRA